MTHVNVKFKEIPLCETCKKKPAVSFSQINNEWFFTCFCTGDSESYFIYLDDFFDSPDSTVDWLCQLRPKVWMDWQDFGDMMRRFRSAIRPGKTLTKDVQKSRLERASRHERDGLPLLISLGEVLRDGNDKEV